jgi:hypothetical protein
MKPHTDGSARRGGAMATETEPAGAFSLASRDTNAHTTSHATPKSPVHRKAPRQPQRSAMGVTMMGVITAPSDPPL